MEAFFAVFRRIYYYTVRCLTWLFGAAKKTSGLPPVVYQIVHLLLVAVIVGLLGFFSRDLPGGDNIDSEYEFVRAYYYGIVAFLVYLFIRLVIYVVRLFLAPVEAEFPDIDEAWRAGIQGLARQRLDCRAMPIIVILGLAEYEEASFFAGAGLNPTVIEPGVDRKGAPLRFFATNHALFLTLPGVSALNCQWSHPPVTAPVTGQLLESAPSDGTQSPGSSQSDGAQATLQPGQQWAAGQTLQPGPFGAGGTLRPGQVQSRTTQPVQSVAAGLSADELDLCRRRLRYVCRLIARERQPFCPINGALVTVSLHAADTMGPIIAQAGTEDIRNLHAFTEMCFPTAIVFSGWDQLSGITEFVRRASQVDPRFGGHLRAGSHFATGRPVDSASADWVIRRGVEWFRRWIYSAFAQDPSASSNATLYRFLCSLDARRARLSQCLTSVLAETVHGETPRLTGCYFSGNDPSARRHLFVKDVLAKLIEEQDGVAWSWSRIRRDQVCRAWSYAAWGLVAALTAADVWLLTYLL